MVIRKVAPKAEKRRPELTLLEPAPASFKVGYARVSTQEQILDVQMNALRNAGCINIYQEKVSGAGKKRPQLRATIFVDDARRRETDDAIHRRSQN